MKGLFSRFLFSLLGVYASLFLTPCLVRAGLLNPPFFITVAFVIFVLIGIFRRIRFKIKYDFLKIAIYLSLLFGVIVYGSLIRCYFLSHLGFYFEYLLPCFILYVSDSSLSTSNDDTSTHIVSSNSPHSLIPPGNPQPEGNLLSFFGNQDPGGEIELYARVRLLEARLIERLPPQLNSGEYENLVRDNLNQAKSVMHYQSALSNELFDISVLELKANIQDKLFDLLMAEPDEQLLAILRDSPFPERAIRPEALDFLEGKLNLLNLGNPHPHAYGEKVLLQTTLELWLRNLIQFNRNAVVYTEFISHFRNI